MKTKKVFLTLEEIILEIRNKKDTNFKNNKNRKQRPCPIVFVNNPRQFWTKIKQQYKRRDTQTDTLTVHDLHKHFKDLFGSDQDQEVMTQDDLNENISNDFLDSDITYEELKKQYFHRTTLKVVELTV